MTPFRPSMKSRTRAFVFAVAVAGGLLAIPPAGVASAQVSVVNLSASLAASERYNIICGGVQ